MVLYHALLCPPVTIPALHVCTRVMLQQDDTPGPGAYSLPSSFGQQGVAFTMGAKPAAATAAAAASKAAAEDLPGPGTYYNPR
jgi:hypothetical protein